VDNKHLAMWCGPSSTQTLILGTSPSTKTKPLNRTQSRVVIGLLSGHTTPGRHLHLMELINSSLCRRCGTKEETSVHILWAIWNVNKAKGLPWHSIRLWGTMGLF
jgi:hypothetical protein